MKNLMEQIKKQKINPRYDATVEDFYEIRKASSDIVALVFNSFSFGYMRGYKAAIAAIKKAGVR